MEEKLPRDHPSGELPPLLPTQVERLEFTLEQMREISNPMRAEVFWCFHASIRKSVNDIAKEIGRSAQTVHYHVNGLVEIGLIVPAETRPRRSRIEQLYVRKARISIDPMLGVSDEYNRHRIRGFKLETQRMSTENSYFFGLVNDYPLAGKCAAFRKGRLMLTPERADKLRYDMVGLMMEAFADQTPAEEGGAQVNAVIYMRPTVNQMRMWAEELGIPLRDLGNEKDTQENTS